MKKCTKCNEEKELDMFGACKKSKDGKRTQCKKCQYEYKQSRKHLYDRSKNDNKYREANKEKISLQRAEYRKTDAYRDAQYKSNMKRRSTKQKVTFSPHQRTELLERDQYTCQGCGKEVHDRRTGDWNTHDKAHIDHIIPISKGGSSDPGNLQILCRTCNLSKRNKVS